MTFVITEPCISTCDTACVAVCPVDCIHGPIDKEGAGAEIGEASSKEGCQGEGSQQQGHKSRQKGSWEAAESKGGRQEKSQDDEEGGESESCRGPPEGKDERKENQGETASEGDSS